MYRGFYKFQYNYLQVRRSSSFLKIDDADVDWKYFTDPSNHSEIIQNCERRLFEKKNVSLLLKKAAENREAVLAFPKMRNKEVESLRRDLMSLPNRTHPSVSKITTDKPTLLEEVGIKPSFTYHPATFESLAKRLNMIRTQFLGHMCGSKGYYLKQDLANLERALINFTLERLLKRGFKLVSVPDIVCKSVLEGCGMKTRGEHSQVFHIDESWGENLCLSGTAEMSLAAFCAKKLFRYEELPIRFCAVSRCYRAEAKKSQTEKGIYRVHYFTKVEMFGVTSAANGNESELLMQEFIEIQKSLFTELGLHFKVLAMPPCELGLPAYHKIDIETWMPGRKIYGEISSTSNCIDYQSRRMQIKYIEPVCENSNGELGNNQNYCHTVNGTACAVPRMLIALFENFQNYNGSINLPVPLQKYMNKERISDKFKEICVCTKPVK